jgi:Flp pilus assembly pilin Flp
MARPFFADEMATTQSGATAGASLTSGGGTSQMYELLMRPLVRLQIAVAEMREREDGQTTTEYAILLGFLAIAIIIALFFLRNVLRNLFSTAASSVSNAPG